MPALSASTAGKESSEIAGVREFALFQVGRYRLGIEVSSVREIVNPLPITPLPGSEPFVRGLVNLRGRIVTLIDLGSKLGEQPATERDEYNIVLVEEGERMAGLAVDDIIHIARLSPSEIDASRQALDRVGFSSIDLQGAAEVRDQLFYILDTAAVFSSTFS